MHSQRANQQVQLPETFLGWTTDEVAQYSPDTLFEYINGSAEVYRALNVKQVYARRYSKPDAPDIIADVFEFYESADAYGAYHHDIREGKDPGIGQEGEQLGSSLSFWKGRYFVSLIGFDDTDAIQEALPALARKIAETIADPGEPPALSQQLPKQNLLNTQIHYFRTHPLLNTFTYLGQENILQLDGATVGMMGRYTGNDNQQAHILLLIDYPSQEQARRAARGFKQKYFAGNEDGQIAQSNDGRWYGYIQQGTKLACWLKAPDLAVIQQQKADVLNQWGELNNEKQ